MDKRRICSDSFLLAATLLSDERLSFPVNDDGGQHGGGDWSYLPKIILYYILKFLNIRIHTPILRAVCRSWRSSLPLSQIPKLPLYFHSPTLSPSTLPVLPFYTRFYLITPLSESHSPWLVRVADVTRFLDRNYFQLQNPIDGSNYFHPQPPFKVSLDFLGCKVTEVAACFSLRDRAISLFNCLSEKVVGNWDLNSVKMVSLLAKLTAKKGGGLVFLEIGMPKWINIKEMKTSNLKEKRILQKFDNVGDIVCYNGKFYAFDVGVWKVGVINNTPWIIKFIDGPKGVKTDFINGLVNWFARVDGNWYVMKGMYFVPWRNGLYLVFEMSGYDFDLEIKEKLIVYELDEDLLEWNKVKSIGQQIFFIGKDVAFSTPAELLPEWKPGSICLFTQGRLKYPKYCKGFRICLYNMEDDEEKGIVPFEDLSKKVYMGLFFPPPPWVKLTCPEAEVFKLGTLLFIKLLLAMVAMSFACSIYRV